MNKISTSDKKYLAFIAIIAAILLFIGAVFIFTVLRPAVLDYENSRIENTVSSYMEKLNRDKWNDSIKSAADALASDYQSADEIETIIKDYLSKSDIYCYNDFPISDKITYELGDDRGKIGEVTFEEDSSYVSKMERFPRSLFKSIWPLSMANGAKPWTCTCENFDFSFLASPFEISVPSTFTVKVNGAEIPAEYITEDNVPYDFLSDYYADHPSLMKKVTYTIPAVVGDANYVIYDSNGLEFTPDVSLGDKQYALECTDAERSELQSFMENGFVEAHIRFWGIRQDPDSTATYPELMKYVKKGCQLQQDMYEYAMDGATWCSFTMVVISNMRFKEALSFGDGLYLVTETVDVASYGDKTVSETDRDISVIVERQSDGSLLVIDQY